MSDEAPADPRARDALVEASLVAVAQEALAGGKPTCASLDEWLGDACLPSFRCGPKGPLTGRETSRQDEPLCDRAALSAAVKAELARAPKDVLDVGSESRPGLFAYASLLAEDKVPEGFLKAHARRRYAVVQPKSPACDAVEPGKACHCDEATMRDWACRHPGERSVAVGLCRFEVDDEGHRITGVVATPPP